MKSNIVAFALSILTSCYNSNTKQFKLYTYMSNEHSYSLHTIDVLDLS